MKTSKPPALFITGLGMVSSLGFDAPTCCAAARASLSRAANSADYVVLGDEGEDVGVVCHALPFGSTGFEGEVRLARLVELAWADLLARSPWLMQAEAIKVYLAMPDLNRGGLAVEDPAARVEAEHRTAAWWQQLRAADGRSLLPLRLSRHTGPTGLVQAIEAAQADLASGTVTAAVVGAVDSLLDEATLQWLESTDRLKSIDCPMGLQPGEGAAFLVLQSDRHAASGDPIASLLGIGRGHESHPRGAERSPSGVGLAQGIHGALVAGSIVDQRFWCIGDQNGEYRRAMEWGCAQVLLDSTGVGQRMAPNAWTPAAAFGDTGAAASAMAICIAGIAMKRRYAPAELAIVTASSDHGGERVALALGRV